MSDSVLRLVDGRALGYAEWGERDGYPIVHFHGSPSSRLDGATIAPWLATHGVRFIGVDRPGIGLSDPKPHRALIDWPDDVAALVDALGLERFAVSGLSAGGPSAVATAWKLADRVAGTVIISGVGPQFDAGESLNADNEARRQRAAAARDTPEDVFTMYEAVAGMVGSDAEGMVNGMLGSMSAEERALFDAATQAFFTASLREAFRQGGAGVATDDVINNGRTWGFDPGGVRGPVELWHGDADAVVPYAHAQYLAARIPNARLHTIQGAGHFAFVTLREEPYERLLKLLR